VVGKDIPVGLLQAIAEPAKEELRAALGRLQAAEFLYETRYSEPAWIVNFAQDSHAATWRPQSCAKALKSASRRARA